MSKLKKASFSFFIGLLGVFIMLDGAYAQQTATTKARSAESYEEAIRKPAI